MGQNGYLTLSEDGKTIKQCQWDYKGEVIIPEGVEEITIWSFMGCSGITSIVIPSSLTDFEYSDLPNSFELKKIVVDVNNPNYSSEDGVLYSKDKSLLLLVPRGKDSIKIPDGVTEIRGWAFSNCTSITSIKIPSSVMKIGENAFRGCTGLITIEIRNKKTKIEKNAFKYCDNLILSGNWKKYPIHSTAYLGFAFCGEVSADGDGFVLLSDEDVKQLVAIIQKNEGETDVEALDLENQLPEIYNLLDKACRETAREAAYKHFLIEGFENDYDPLDEDKIEELESEIDFHFEIDLDDYRDADGNLNPRYFDENGDEIPEAFEDERMSQLINCVHKYADNLDEKKLVDFIHHYYDLNGFNFDFDNDYSVNIPDEIIKMANTK